MIETKQQRPILIASFSGVFSGGVHSPIPRSGIGGPTMGQCALRQASHAGGMRSSRGLGSRRVGLATDDIKTPILPGRSVGKNGRCTVLVSFVLQLDCDFELPMAAAVPATAVSATAVSAATTVEAATACSAAV